MTRWLVLLAVFLIAGMILIIARVATGESWSDLIQNHQPVIQLSVAGVLLLLVILFLIFFVVNNELF